MVSPPPGVSSGARVPPIASARPRDSARPRPDAGVVVPVAEPLERQEHLVPVGPRGMPGPWSTTRSSTGPPCSLAVTSGGRSGRAEPQRVGDQVDQDPFQQAGVGADRGQVGGDAARATCAAGSPELVERRRDRVLQADRRPATRPSTPACRRLMSSRFADQPGEPVQRLVGGGQQFVAVVARRSRPRRCAGWSTAALAEASGVRRSWLTAASSAVRIRSASASGLAGRGLLGQPLLAQRERGLGGERLDDPPVGRRRAAGRAAPATGRRRRRTSTSPSAGVQARRLADGGGDPPGLRVALPVRAGRRVRAAFQQGDRGRARRSPAAVPAARSAAARRAARCRRRWPGSARRRWPGPPPGYAGRRGRRPR